MNAIDLYAQYGEAIRGGAFIIAFWALLFAYHHFFGRKSIPAEPCKMCGKGGADDDGLCSTCWWDMWVDEGQL